MTRDGLIDNKIALLATGDEITNGDILNTNSQIIAQKLFDEGMRVGMHIAVADNLYEIEDSIRFLLKNHKALIITGGLGPTSDDITRYGLSKAIDSPLEFSEKEWDVICQRFKTLGYQSLPPEGNRQQALFPSDATVIANPEGTASGCYIQHENRLIFMLPGPPPECLNMIDKVVLPQLKQANFSETFYYHSWFLFGASEGQIASELDAIVKPFICTTGYRLFYPYIEFKLFSNNKSDFNTLFPLIEERIKPYLIHDGTHTASDLLREKLTQINFILSIKDLATGGLLENKLKTPATSPYVNFTNPSNPMIEIKGLNEFWEGKNCKDSQLDILFSNGKSIRKKIPFRGERIKQYAVEFICQQVYGFLTQT